MKPLPDQISLKIRSIHRGPVVEVVDDLMVPVLRAKSPSERLQIAAGMWRCARDMYLAQARQELSAATPQEIQQAAVKRLSYGLE